MQGIVLIAHGSRRREANQDLVDLAAAVAERSPEAIVEIGYLEFAQPGIAEGLQRCAARGARRIVMVPYFLSTGVHVTRDLEEARSEFSSQNPEVTVVMARALELHPQIIDIVIERIAGATPQAGGVPDHSE